MDLFPTIENYKDIANQANEPCMKEREKEVTFWAGSTYLFY